MESTQPGSGIASYSVGGDSLLAWKGDHPETRLVPLPTSRGPLRLAVPRLRENLPALRGPAYRLLSNSEIKKSPASARAWLECVDSTGDDTGVVSGERYTYPNSPLFAPGAFDITAFSVAEDTSDIYLRLTFRALADPGWHPEYGFQLTYVAIALDTGPGGERTVPMNASYILPEARAYERLILLGGGVRVEDARGTILAAYQPVPEDAANPLGDAASGVIDLALPRALLGDPTDQWHFTILAGAQDDHGGAGLGEFRTVNRTPGEWNGGGRLRADDPNVYDVLEAGRAATGAGARPHPAPEESPERR